MIFLLRVKIYSNDYPGARYGPLLYCRITAGSQCQRQFLKTFVPESFFDLIVAKSATNSTDSDHGDHPRALVMNIKPGFY